MYFWTCSNVLPRKLLVTVYSCIRMYYTYLHTDMRQLLCACVYNHAHFFTYIQRLHIHINHIQWTEKRHTNTCISLYAHKTTGSAKCSTNAHTLYVCWRIHHCMRTGRLPRRNEAVLECIYIVCMLTYTSLYAHRMIVLAEWSCLRTWSERNRSPRRCTWKTRCAVVFVRCAWIYIYI